LDLGTVDFMKLRDGDDDEMVPSSAFRESEWRALLDLVVINVNNKNTLHSFFKLTIGN
jgi:hypothetical protein